MVELPKPAPFDYEEIPFVIDTSLIKDSPSISEEEVMLIAAALFEIVPADRHSERMWSRAARLIGVSRRDFPRCKA